MPRKKQSKRINIDSRERWKSILKTVTKDEVPVALIQVVTVNLIDGTQVDVDIRELLAEGFSNDEIEVMLNTRLQALDNVIKDVDFFINIDSVAKTVQPVTDDILKNF
jgi:uncharacterized membrane protein YqiK